jgi:hypothetical protein
MIVVTLFIMIVFGSEQLCLVQPKQIFIMKKITFLILFVCSLAQSQIAFKHVVTYSDAEIRDNIGRIPIRCTIDNSLINNNPNLVLIVTADYGITGPYHNASFSVFYSEGKWRLSSYAGIQENTKVNVFAVPTGERAFVHTATASSATYTIINHPLLNNRPEAKFLISKASQYNSKEVGIAYAPSINRWTILNLDLSPFNAYSYNVLINDNLFEATATAPVSNWFTINHPTTNDGRNNLLFTTPIFQGAATSVNPTGVWYNKNKWNIYNQNRAAMPANGKYFVLSLNSPGYTNTDNEVHITTVPIRETFCPRTLTQGDREFAGHGPRTVIIVTLNVINERQIEATIDFTATETVADFSQVKETWRRIIYTAPNSKRIAQILTPRVTTFDVLNSDDGTQFIRNERTGNVEILPPPNNFIAGLTFVGDTSGDDISSDTDCTDDTRIIRIDFYPIKIRFAN